MDMTLRSPSHVTGIGAVLCAALQGTMHLKCSAAAAARCLQLCWAAALQKHASMITDTGPPC